MAIKRVLLATDLSARSDRALERAVQLTRDQGAALTVLHVIDDSLPSALAMLQEKSAQQALTVQISKLEQAGDRPVSIETAIGRAHLEIAACAKRSQADLIVIGLHRENTLVDMFRGTTAERVIRTGPLPVLMVKDAVVRPYRRVLIGVDFSVHARRAVEAAAKLVPKGELHLLHAYSVPFAGFMSGQTSRQQVSQEQQATFEAMIAEELSAFLNALGDEAPRLHRHLQEGTVREVVARQIQRLEPDLLAIGTHGRTGVAHALLGSVAEDILRDPPCDVLTVHAW